MSVSPSPRKIDVVHASHRDVSLLHSPVLPSSPPSSQARANIFDKAAQEFTLNEIPNVPSAHLQWMYEAQRPPQHNPPLFDVRKMRALLDHHNLQLRDTLYQLLKHPDFHASPDLSLSQQRAHVMKMWKKVAALGYLQNSISAGTVEGRQRYEAVIESCGLLSHSLDIKMSVHYGLFGATIKLLGDDQQSAKWLPLTESCQMLGCFALTELGHGSNARGVETVATYHVPSRSFTVNTPTDSAQKYWIGGAYQTARWTVCFAQLYVKGVCYGVHPFLVRIRNEDGSNVHGVTLGDCGHKCGLNGVDNGRIWFDNVSVPLDQMLRRYSQVSADGTYTSRFKSADERFGASLASLSGGRVSVAAGCLNQAKIGLSIAIRYALSRRAFGPRNGEEVRLLDYQSHQYRLIPGLATTYVMLVVLNELKYVWHHQQLGKKLHIWSSGFKALMTWHSLATLQEAREACGGQGYKSENRIGPIKNGHDVAVTYEGDNHILLQAVTKSVLPEFVRGVKDGAMFKGHFSYLNDRHKLRDADLSALDVGSVEFARIVFRRREAAVFARLANRLQVVQKNGMTALEAFNSCGVLVEEAARAHTELLIVELFDKRMKELEAQGEEDLMKALRRCGSIYALKRIDEDSGFVRNGSLSGIDGFRAHERLLEMCKDMRPHVMDYVNGFGIPAHLLAPIAFDYVAHNSRARL
ncbi:acyl-CoA oxidase [Gracilaria domingensis]|nr:acyl-CoA oxidase [Gracilaria domingensis]